MGHANLPALVVSTNVLSPTQQQNYERDGYLLIKRSFAAVECEALREVADRVARRQERGAQGISPDNPRTVMGEGHGRPEINNHDPIRDGPPRFRDAAPDGRLTDVVAALFGARPLLVKDKLIFKIPGHEGFG